VTFIVVDAGAATAMVKAKAAVMANSRRFIGMNPPLGAAAPVMWVRI